MPLPIYPDIVTVIPSTLPLAYSSSQAVLSTEFENGLESRRLVQNSIRRDVALQYSTMTFPQANTLRRFYEARNGSFDKFVFWFPQNEIYVNEYVGVITAVSVQIKLPSVGAESGVRTLKRDGTDLVEGVDWTFVSGGTTFQPTDEASLAEVTELGQIYTFDFSGRLSIDARFTMAPIVFADVKKYWSSTTVELVGLEHVP